MQPTVFSAWQEVLPSLKWVVDHALAQATVPYRSGVTFEEWIAQSPSLAVHWSVPSRAQWKDVLGRSVSFLLCDQQTSWEFWIWGAVWRDNWDDRKRRVREIREEKIDADMLRHGNVDVFVDKVTETVSSLVSEVSLAKLESPYREIPLPQTP